MITLKGKVALVTGGGAGIGRAIAEQFVELGASVVIAEIDPARVQNATEAFKGQDVLVVRTDVTKTAEVATCIAAADKRFGKLDIVVNNVGDFLGVIGRFENHTEEQWERLYEINLKHMFIVTRAALPLLRKSTGDRSIINISTIEALRGIPFCPIYSAFKAGILGFTRSLSLELAPEGIRVNAIAPETTETEQVKAAAMIKPQYRENVPRLIPLGRFGTPKDIAGCAVFLATELSAWVTGTTISPDGGALAAGGFYRTPQGHWTNCPAVTDTCLGL